MARVFKKLKNKNKSKYKDMAKKSSQTQAPKQAPKPEPKPASVNKKIGGQPVTRGGEGGTTPKGKK